MTENLLQEVYLQRTQDVTKVRSYQATLQASGHISIDFCDSTNRDICKENMRWRRKDMQHRRVIRIVLQKQINISEHSYL